MSYAVLGDDVVIADQEVASVYEKARNFLAFSALRLKEFTTYKASIS